MADEEKRRWTGPRDSANAPSHKTHVNVNKKKLKPSSKQWVERQLNDPYVTRAQVEGYRARAAFKLIELDERFHLLSSGIRVLDLGAAPGGWSQVVVKHGAARVVGVDLLPVKKLAGATFFEGDFLDDAVADALVRELGGKPDLVMSDMAANTTGHSRTDQIAMEHLAPGGAFVTKAFQGGLDAALLARLKSSFDAVRHAKPPASRAESSEVYLVATGFTG
jgi:23S rRNA (uridine2552-2'-O)-methyltransferase